VKGDPEKGRQPHLMDVAGMFFAGMDEDESLHDENQQKSGQDRPASRLIQYSAGLRQHMEKYRTEQNSSAETEQERQRPLRQCAHQWQEAAEQGNEHDRREI